MKLFALALVLSIFPLHSQAAKRDEERFMLEQVSLPRIRTVVPC